MIPQRPYGKSGLMVSVLGPGVMQIGDPNLEEAGRISVERRA